MGVGCINLEVSYGGRVIFRNVDLVSQPGKLLAITGRSGCGKTTLLAALGNRLDNFSRRKVITNGETFSYNDTTGERTFDTTETRYLPAVTEGIPDLAIGKILRYTAELSVAKNGAENAANLSTRILRLCKLQNAAHRPIASSLGSTCASTGESKRTLIATELCSGKRNGRIDCLLLDEPTANLDTAVAIAMMQLLKRLLSAGAIGSIICTLHQPSPTMIALCDGMVNVEDGTLRALTFNSMPFLEPLNLKQVCESTIRTEAEVVPPKQRCTATLLWVREVYVLCKLIFHSIFGTPIPYIILPILLVMEGITVGLMFRGLQFAAMSTKHDLVPISMFESPNFRAAEVIAADNNTVLDDYIRLGVRRDKSADFIETVVTNPNTYEVLHRFLQCTNSLWNLNDPTAPISYSSSYYLLARRNASFLNDISKALEDDRKWSGNDAEDEFYDSDLTFDGTFQFATPRFIVTQALTGLQILHYSMEQIDWQNFEACQKAHSNSGYQFWLCVMKSYEGFGSDLLQCLGLPRLLSRSSHINEVGGVVDHEAKEIRDLGGGGDLEKDNDESFELKESAARRKLFLKYDESQAVFKHLRQLMYGLHIPGGYEVMTDWLSTLSSGLSRGTAMFFLVGGLGFVSLDVLVHWYKMMPSIERDIANDHFRRSSFYLAFCLNTIVTGLITGGSLAVAYVLAAGSTSVGPDLMGLVITSVLSVWAANGCTTLVMSVSREIDGAMQRMPVILTFTMLYSSFFVRSYDLPDWAGYTLTYLSPQRWTMFALMNQAYRPKDYTNSLRNSILLGVAGAEGRSIFEAQSVLFLQGLFYRIAGWVAFICVRRKNHCRLLRAKCNRMW